MQKISLGLLGFLFIIGAAISNTITGPAQNASEAMGKGIASLFMVLIGVVLIIVHLVKKRKQ